MTDLTRRKFFMKMAAALPVVYVAPLLIANKAHASSPSIADRRSGGASTASEGRGTDAQTKVPSFLR